MNTPTLSQRMRLPSAQESSALPRTRGNTARSYRLGSRSTRWVLERPMRTKGRGLRLKVRRLLLHTNSGGQWQLWGHWEERELHWPSSKVRHFHQQEAGQHEDKRPSREVCHHPVRLQCWGRGRVLGEALPHTWVGVEPPVRVPGSHPNDGLQMKHRLRRIAWQNWFERISFRNFDI